jgi:diaminopimelate decarboxylase
MTMLLGTQRVNSAGHLEVGGCDTLELAREFGTPLYVMDEALIRNNCRAFRAAFEARYPKNVICFAGKSFHTMAMCRIVEQEGLNLDVASGGELYVALEAGFSTERINLHGNNKSADELEMAVRAGVGHVVLDNFQEIAMLGAVVRAQDAMMDVLIRATPGVDPHTHKFISTGQADTKFGFNIKNGDALKAVQAVLETPGLKFDGVHCHVGSQLLDTEAHEGAVEALVGLMAEIRDATDAICNVVNIGGGLGVRYRKAHQPPTLDDYAEVVVTRLKEKLEERGLPLPILQQEPGRAIVGEAGTTLYTVGAIKTVPITEEPGQRTYVAIDGGLSDNPRPQLYDAVYELIVANRAAEPHDRVITLAGKHCETDVLIWNVHSTSVCPGDVIAVQTTGAYNYVMASNYNKFLRPAVVLVGDGRADLIVERESYADLVRRDRIPERLQSRA